MGRLLAIDFGRKRCGIAVTDPSRIIANSLTTVATHTLEEFLRGYMATEEVDALIVGEPRDMRGNPSESQRFLQPALQRLRKAFPQLNIIMYDERFTSVLAHRAMLDGGMHRQQRQDKAAVDAISASIILNDYLQSRAYCQGAANDQNPQ